MVGYPWPVSAGVLVGGGMISKQDLLDWIRAQRDAAGWSNVVLGRVLGCDPSVASRIVSGVRSMSAIELLLMIDALGRPSPLAPISPEAAAAARTVEDAPAQARADIAAIAAAAARMPDRDRKKLAAYLAD